MPLYAWSWMQLPVEEPEKDALDGLKRAIETYIEYMISEGRKKEMYRPVPMNELKQFLFPEVKWTPCLRNASAQQSYPQCRRKGYSE